MNKSDVEKAIKKYKEKWAEIPGFLNAYAVKIDLNGFKWAILLQIKKSYYPETSGLYPDSVDGIPVVLELVSGLKALKARLSAAKREGESEQ